MSAVVAADTEIITMILKCDCFVRTSEKSEIKCIGIKKTTESSRTNIANAEQAEAFHIRLHGHSTSVIREKQLATGLQPRTLVGNFVSLFQIPMMRHSARASKE